MSGQLSIWSLPGKVAHLFNWHLISWVDKSHLLIGVSLKHAFCFLELQYVTSLCVLSHENPQPPGIHMALYFAPF